MFNTRLGGDQKAIATNTHTFWPSFPTMEVALALRMMVCAILVQGNLGLCGLLSWIWGWKGTQKAIAVVGDIFWHSFPMLDWPLVLLALVYGIFGPNMFGINIGGLLSWIWGYEGTQKAMAANNHAFWPSFPTSEMTLNKTKTIYGILVQMFWRIWWL